MGYPVCNSTLEDQRIEEQPIWHGITFHTLGLWLSAVFGLIAILVSFFLIFMHATHYLRPYEQRHIIRILFMVPIYAAVSFLSYKFYLHTVYYEVLRDCYEAFAIASFFSLLCSYLAEDLHAQKEYFRTIKPKRWIFPVPWLAKCCGGENGMLRTPRSGLTWFNVVWVCVFQYCFIRVFMTIIAVATQAFDLYCLESLNPAFSHVWIMVIEAAAVSIAMYCVIQFYFQIKGDIQQHSPLMKIIAIKLVIFLSFWQTLLISFLTSTGAIKPSDQIQTPDIKVGIPAMLLCIEMALFAIFHIFAFSWRPYVIGSSSFKASTAADGQPTPDHYKGGFLGLKALVDAFNPWDLVKAVGRSARWLFVRRKHRLTDSSYQNTRLGNTFKPARSGTDPQELDGQTSYIPPRPVRPSEEDRETLLSAPQPVPSYPTQYSSAGTSPNRPDNSDYFRSGDIGIAQTTDDDARYYTTPSTPMPQPYTPYSHHQSNSSAATSQRQQHQQYQHTMGDQQSGIVSIPPSRYAHDARHDEHDHSGYTPRI